jgi:FkbM family methyltransferase
MGLLRLIQKRWIMYAGPEKERRALVERKRWNRDNGEAKRFQYPHLTKGSVVVDLGGHEGIWAAGLLSYYDVNMHIFEPHPGFAAKLRSDFRANPKVRVHPVAMASSDTTFSITDDGPASTARSGAATVTCQAVEALAYLKSINVDTIDLIKINIEGGEYDILPHLIRTGIISKIDTIQVQFHPFEPEDEKRREAIVRDLAKTHEQTWCYLFVFEQWKRKSM